MTVPPSSSHNRRVISHFTTSREQSQSLNPNGVRAELGKQQRETSVDCYSEYE